MKKIFLSTIACFFLFFTVHAQTNTNYGTNAGNAGSDNSCFGYSAGDVVTGVNNSCFGSLAGLSTTTGYWNTFIGYRVGVLNTTGYYNVMLGAKAGTYNSTGNYNVYIGTNSGYSNSSGNNNTMIGNASGFNNAGTGNVFIGYQSGYSETGSNKLYIDNSSTTTPLIYGDFSSRALTFNGNVGIGISPGAKLDVNGDIYIKGKISFNSGNRTFYTGITIDGSGNILFNSGPNAPAMKLYPTGVTIGCDATGFLKVNGKIQATEMEIKTAPCSDFVFEKNYKLMRLSDLEKYVTANKHLPEVPSAKEFAANGYSIGQMDDVLLRKVEELTLYVIEQNKRLETLEKENVELKNKLK